MDDVPVYGIKKGWKHPRVVLAKVNSLFCGGIQTAELGRDMVREGSILDCQ